MSRNPDSLNVPIEWHRFLYRYVLLEWETSLSDRQKFSPFRPRKPICGVELAKVDALKDIEAITRPVDDSIELVVTDIEEHYGLS